MTRPETTTDAVGKPNQMSDGVFWAKNLLLGALCLVGVGAIASGLRPAPELADQFAEPIQFDDSIQAVASRIDTEFHEHWKKLELEPSQRASEAKIARRISLGLTGAIPSLEEIRALEKRPNEERVAWWTDRVLGDKRFADYAAERFARSYVGTENGPFIVFRRRRFVTWLSDRLANEETGYDELVRELIADAGIWTSSPSVNFLTVTMNEEKDGKPDAIRLAGRTSRAFLGMRIDCLQCHDDRLGDTALGESMRDGLQEDFHQLAAFFSEARIGPLGIVDGKEEYRYKYLHADDESLVEPIAPFLNELVPAEGTRRERLAAWVTHPDNRPFARTAVNRIWALMFGKPLVEPIDNIPFESEFPPGMETLADDLIEHNFNLHRLVRIIAATEVFQLDSEASHEITIGHEMAWAAFPLSRLRPEQVAGAVIQSASIRTIDANSHIIFQLMKFGQTGDFVKRYGDTGEDEFDERAGTIAQRLLMMNGNLVKEKTKPELTNASQRIATLAPTDEKAIETVFLTTLSRRPGKAEMAHFVERIEGLKGDERSQRMEDITWSLLNSTEFSWNH